MSTLQEIKDAISQLSSRDKAVLAAELSVMEVEPEAEDLEKTLQRGLQDMSAGRVRPMEEVREMIPQWISKS